MKIPVNAEELSDRIRLNYDHLKNDPYYSIDEVFSPSDYAWYGDKEGRALLAFMSHYKISGEKISCMDEMLSELPRRFNEEGYLGPLFRGKIHEEQLSGHSWLLRGLCEHFEVFSDSFSLTSSEKIAENLYLTLAGRIGSYPVEREKNKNGGVSGEMAEESGCWLLSSDIGCAFMSIDGLSHVYKIKGNEKIRALLDEMIDFYLSIDKIKLRAQTHCTLTAARGMLRMYDVTGEDKYLKGAESIFSLYVNHAGMTLTYQNLNWWGREDSWTEPCAVVDSLMVALDLYKFTKIDEYRVLAARIYHNGLASAQRDNGGAGTDTLICNGSPHKSLHPLMYEAFFCCSMRLAEGLWYINKNAELLYAQISGVVTKNSNGIYTDGDIIYVLPDKELLAYAQNGVTADSMMLYPIVKGYKVPKDIYMNCSQRVIFE